MLSRAHRRALRLRRACTGWCAFACSMRVTSAARGRHARGLAKTRSINSGRKFAGANNLNKAPAQSRWRMHSPLFATLRPSTVVRTSAHRAVGLRDDGSARRDALRAAAPVLQDAHRLRPGASSGRLSTPCRRSDMPSKDWLRDDLRAMAVENSRASGRDVDKIDCFMSVLQGIGPQAACCRRRRPVARTIARTIARTCCRKHARARARARARPNAHCPRPHTRPHKGDRGSRSGGRRRRGQRAMARRV